MRLNNRLKSRYPLSLRMNFISNEDNGMISSRAWANEKWRKTRWNVLKHFIPFPMSKPPGCDLKRSKWVLLNRIRSGYGRFDGFNYKIGLSNNPHCLCGEVQTAQHVLNCQRIGIRGDIKSVDDDFKNWLRFTPLDI